MVRIALALAAGLCVASMASAEEPSFKRTEDVVYGRKFGTALTMDVFTPAKPNGVGLIFVVSGGWFSSHEAINAGFMQPFLNRGYTVFAVVHGSQPKFTITEISGRHASGGALYPASRGRLWRRSGAARHHGGVGRRTSLVDAGGRRYSGRPER